MCKIAGCYRAPTPEARRYHDRSDRVSRPDAMGTSNHEDDRAAMHLGASAAFRHRSQHCHRRTAGARGMQPGYFHTYRALRTPLVRHL